MLGYLLAKPVIWCKKPVPLAVNGRVSTPTNGIHFPMSVVIVNHVKIPMPTPAVQDYLTIYYTIDNFSISSKEFIAFMEIRRPYFRMGNIN